MSNLIDLHAAARRPEVVSRFWAKVQTAGAAECWIWSASVNTAGYGQMNVGSGRIVRAHRMAYVIAKGPIPSGFVVRHTCDIPPCVNPSHLLVGRQTENIADMHDRGRASGGRLSRPGEASPLHKISESEALSIRDRRERGESVTAIAQSLGISKAQVSRIANGLRWTHLTEAGAR